MKTNFEAQPTFVRLENGIRAQLTDALHEVCGIRTDYQFITRQKMKGIQKVVKAENKLLYSISKA